jgi:chromate transporter
MADEKAPEEQKKTRLIDLFLVFAKIGVMTIGGGLTMLPLLQREIVERTKWATEDELLDYYAISQCTPGIIAVNTATFVGSKQRKTLGGIFATLGMVFPCIVIITVIAALLAEFAHYPVVQNAFRGIRAGVCALMLNTVIKLFKKSVKGALTGAIWLVVCLGMLFLNISPILYVVAAALLGIVLHAETREGGPLK